MSAQSSASLVQTIHIIVPPSFHVESDVKSVNEKIWLAQFNLDARSNRNYFITATEIKQHSQNQPDSYTLAKSSAVALGAACSPSGKAAEINGRSATREHGIYVDCTMVNSKQSAIVGVFYDKRRRIMYTISEY